MNVNKRLSDLENETGAGDDVTGVIVNWGDEPDPGQVLQLSNGLRLTYAEYKRRFPEADTKTVSWDDLGDEA